MSFLENINYANITKQNKQGDQVTKVFPYNPWLSVNEFRISDKGDTGPYVCAQGYKCPLELRMYDLREERG